MFPRPCGPAPCGGSKLRTAPSAFGLRGQFFASGSAFLIFDLNPPGCGTLFLRRAAGAPLQKADCVPLALGQFSRRAAERPCENWSAAPAAAPCFVHRTRSPPLPLLRLAASSAGRASATQPATLLVESPLPLRGIPLRGGMNCNCSSWISVAARFSLRQCQ